MKFINLCVQFDTQSFASNASKQFVNEFYYKLPFSVFNLKKTRYNLSVISFQQLNLLIIYHYIFVSLLNQKI